MNDLQDAKSQDVAQRDVGTPGIEARQISELDTSNQPSGKSKFGFSTWKILALILLLALVLRLWGIDWDQGGLFHPDERAFLSQV